MPPPRVLVAVEGLIDEAVAEKLLRQVGADIDAVYGKRGKPYLRTKIGGYNQSASKLNQKWLVLADLDMEFPCAGRMKEDWLPTPSENLQLRIAVREIEAWLMADRQAMARFLGVKQTMVPESPDSLNDPKQHLMNIAASSSKPLIRAELPPRPGGGRSEGPLYRSQMIAFAHQAWRPEVAAPNSPSLRRSLERLRQMVIA